MMIEHAESHDEPIASSSAAHRSLFLQAPGILIIALVRLYQVTLSPWLGSSCRFQPTCSHYMIGAVRKYGALRGAWRGTLRICRCHPFRAGGYDPP